jgi:membrane associated rhomboid family serine protease
MFLPLRDDTPRLSPPVVTIAIIATACLVFLFQETLPPDAASLLAHGAGAIPWEISHLTDLVGGGQPKDLLPPPLTLYTSLFLHGDIIHLLGNMWFFWLFGNKLESWMGHLRFLLFYFLSGTAAGLLQVASNPDGMVPMVGASGAIAGVLGAYALTFPRARVRCLVFLIFFVTFITLPSAILLGLWFLGQFLAATRSGAEPGIAWFAHVGGFLFGIAAARLFVRPPKRLRLMYHPSS